MTGSRVTTVVNPPASFVIYVQNAGGPFLPAFTPDMTLSVSGATTVNGKLVSSIKGENVSFTPESCNIGTRGRKAFDPGFPREGSQGRFQPCLEEAKIASYVWHSNRHTFCLWLAMPGA